MKKNLRITLALSLCLFSANAAMADDAIWGAVLGGGAGALFGQSVGGRDGAIVGGALGAATGAAIGSQNHRPRGYYAPQQAYYAPPAAPVYYAQPAYYPTQQVYYSQPVRIQQRPVYYVRDGYDRGYRGDRHHHRRDWDRHDNGHGRGGDRH